MSQSFTRIETFNYFEITLQFHPSNTFINHNRRKAISNYKAFYKLHDH